MARVLVVDDEGAVRGMVARLLQRMGCETVDAEDGIFAADKLGEDQFDLVVTDLRMPRADGFAVLNAVKSQRLPTPVIMLTGDGSMADCVTAMKAGAFNFINKPFNNKEFERIVRDALGAAAPTTPSTVVALPDGPTARPQVALIGHSQRLLEVLDTVQRVAATDATVLLTGETGTGKEVVSRLLHGLSRRAIKPFVPINCGAVPEGLGESDLFGHAENATAGSRTHGTGRLMAADGGTLFLDEVGDLSLPVQAKLLRVVQDRQLVPVGDAGPRTVDIRLIAATHCDLEEMTRRGAFREDLYYRLNVVTIELPPLRERAEDIPVLLEYFLEASGRRSGKTLRLEDGALSALMAYHWPGNVRELENLAERLVVLDKNGVVTADDLPRKILGQAVPSWPGGTPAPISDSAPGLGVAPTVAQTRVPTAPPPPPPTTNRPQGFAEGAVVNDRFKLIRKIGEGGSASVFQAQDTELNTDVAIKFLERQLLDDSAATRFKQEVAILRTLSHPNIVRIYEFGTYLDHKYFVMELLSGQDLGAKLRATPGPMPIGLGIDYLVQACGALQVAHDAGITHRDIKPDNLFITGDGSLKVTDFGLAKRAVGTGMTQTGWLAGTPEYIAPEQISGFSHVTHLADLYSLGCVAYRMFTGEPPFTHLEVFPILLMHTNETPEPLRPLNPEISVELEDLILRLLAKDPQARVQSCRELAVALAALRPQ